MTKRTVNMPHVSSCYPVLQIHRKEMNCTLASQEICMRLCLLNDAASDTGNWPETKNGRSVFCLSLFDKLAPLLAFRRREKEETKETRC
jgi:hypothetical protein